jgi:uncharacterized protein YdbL (DUF1318 family)
MTMTRRSSLVPGAAALALLAAAAGAVLPPSPPAAAQPSLAADKALVDAAKARGEVGEQADGYLGFVQGSPSDPGLAAAVAAINAGRRQAYADAASKTGVSIEAAAGAAARQLIARTPPGQSYRNAEGQWVRK